MKKKTKGIIILVIGTMALLGSIANGALVNDLSDLFAESINLNDAISNITCYGLIIGLIILGIIFIVNDKNE